MTSKQEGFQKRIEAGVVLLLLNNLTFGQNQTK